MNRILLFATLTVLLKCTIASGVCKSHTVRTSTTYVYVKFNLPQSIEGKVIHYFPGSYYRYYFPLCHRVWWSRTAFKCVRGTWYRLYGSWHKDHWCHSHRYYQPHMSVHNVQSKQRSTFSVELIEVETMKLMNS